MKGTTEDEMVGWHHQLNGPKFEQTDRMPGASVENPAHGKGHEEEA